MDVVRINMSHIYSEKDLKPKISMIRSEAKKSGRNIAIMMDISGPKIRVNFKHKDIDRLSIVKNRIYSMGYDNINDIPINLDINFRAKKDQNALVKIDDGKISFKILSIENNILQLKALNSGPIISNKGINFPYVDLGIPSITKKDR